MGGFWSLIPLKWKVGLLVGGFGLLVLLATIFGSLAYIHSQTLEQARLECKSAAQDETISALQSAQKAFLDGLQKQYDEEDLINGVPDAEDNGMGRALVDQLNRM